LLFLAALMTLFILGIGMHARLQIVMGLDDPLAAIYSVAQIAMGVPYFVARNLGYELGEIKAVTYEYGNTFTAVGGLLNVLVILDAYDTAMGRRS
jgi:hypothetical protein